MRKKLLTGLLVFALVTAAAGIAAAITRNATGGPNTGIAIVSSDANSSMSSTTYVDLPGMTMVVTTPAGEADLLDIRFSSESACYDGGAQYNWCSVQITVDGVPAAPVDCVGAHDFAFDSTDFGNNTSSSWRSSSMERYRAVNGGKHVIRVQGKVTDFDATGTQVFWTGERILVVETSKRLTAGGTGSCTTTRQGVTQGG
jgi:hypothetical protein